VYECLCSEGARECMCVCVCVCSECKCIVAASSLTAVLPLHHCTTPPLHHCTTASLHHCTTAPLHHSTTAPLHHCTTAVCVCTRARARQEQSRDVRARTHSRRHQQLVFRGKPSGAQLPHYSLTGLLDTAVATAQDLHQPHAQPVVRQSYLDLYMRQCALLGC
jgi:hypothetical protein